MFTIYYEINNVYIEIKQFGNFDMMVLNLNESLDISTKMIPWISNG
jgi:hypothetical protein